MHPAWSILFFTTLAGAGQGLIASLVWAHGRGLPSTGVFQWHALLLATVLLCAGLLSSFFHLGHKRRAWRAALMWRTSWMSREVIILPACVLITAAWTLRVALAPQEPVGPLLPLLALVAVLALWYCTAMIYACLRFVQEWAHGLTIVNFTLIGLSSGCVLGCALAASYGQTAWLSELGRAAMLATALAWVCRAASLRRNASLKQRSTLQSATGIPSPQLVQKSMGMSAGAFNTREFFHHASAWTLQQLRWVFQAALFAGPLLLMALALWREAGWLWWLAVLLQAPGLLAERWLFFAHARHPQNLYYQTVS